MNLFCMTTWVRNVMVFRFFLSFKRYLILRLHAFDVLYSASADQYNISRKVNPFMICFASTAFKHSKATRHDILWRASQYSKRSYIVLNCMNTSLYTLFTEVYISPVQMTWPIMLHYYLSRYGTGLDIFFLKQMSRHVSIPFDIKACINLVFISFNTIYTSLYIISWRCYNIKFPDWWVR